MKIAVRLDDITPDMDWERFLRFKELLDRYQVKPLIGVIPENRDRNLRAEKVCPLGEEGFWQYIKELEQQGWVIAMHGCYHVYCMVRGGIFPLNNFSEFVGLSFDEQKKMLDQGKKLLQERGITTDIFMAPAHSYDQITLRALKASGFQALTDGFGEKPYRFRGLTFYPISFHLARTLQKKEGYSTMVVHTNTVSDDDLKRYEEYFRRTEVEWISYQEYLEAEGKERGICGRIREYLMAAGKGILSRMRDKRREQL